MEPLGSLLGASWGPKVASENGVCRGGWRKNGLTASCCKIIFDLFKIRFGAEMGPSWGHLGRLRKRCVPWGLAKKGVDGILLQDYV